MYCVSLICVRCALVVASDAVLFFLFRLLLFFSYAYSSTYARRCLLRALLYCCCPLVSVDALCSLNRRSLLRFFAPHIFVVASPDVLVRCVFVSFCTLNSFKCYGFLSLLHVHLMFKSHVHI